MERTTSEPDDERLATMLHALGNPVRIAILHYISGHPGCICNDLVVRFGRAQATVSQHLATLRRANILVGERDGQATCYWIDVAEMAWLQQRLKTLTAPPDGESS